MSGAWERARELARMGGAYLRLDATEDLHYPLHVLMSFIFRVVPVIIHFFIAKLIGIGGSDDIGGDYFTFATVGIAITGMLDGALRGFSSRLQVLQSRGLLEGMLVEPVPWTFVPMAMSLWAMVLSTVGAALALATGALLGADLSLAGIPAFLAVIALAMLAAVGVGTLSGALLVLTKRGDPIMNAYNVAAALVAGAVFPVALLPDWIRPFAWLVPHFHAINASRELLMVQPPQTGSVVGGLTGLLVFDLVVVPLGILVFARTLAVARRTGLLGSY